MPELPEVQTTVDGLNRTVKGLVIRDVWTNYNSVHYHGKDEIKDPKFFKKFKAEVVGQKVVGTTRRAKNILIELASGKIILIHMKMTGHLMFGSYVFDKKDVKDPWKPVEEGPLKDPFNRHIRLVFSFDTKGASALNKNGAKKNNTAKEKHLVLSDMRKFAKVTLLLKKDSEVEKPQDRHLSNIGPEPLGADFTFKLFKERILRRAAGKIKSVLMDQSIIAGVGNIYSDEALWRAGIHPEEMPRYVSEDFLKKLYISVKEVLKQGIDFGGDSMSDYRNINGERGEFQSKHQAYRKTGKACGKKGCNGTIQRKVIGGRSAHFCSEHQKMIGRVINKKNSRQEAAINSHKFRTK